MIWNEHQYNGFYIIRNVDVHAGFCALVLYVLNGIRKAEEMNAIPVVDLNKQNTPDFYDPDHGQNIWNYYFAPINTFSYKQVMGFVANGQILPDQIYTPTSEEVMNSHHSEKNRLATFWAQETPSDKAKWMEEKRAIGRDYVKKYLQINSVISQKAQAVIYDNFQQNYVLGIHIRGTDFAYASPTPLDQYFSEIEKIISQNKLEHYRIFIATDQEQYVKAFQERYQSKLFHSNALRSDNHIAPFRLQGNNAYKKGEDVLIDMLVLSKCHHVIKGAAATGEMALWFNDTPEVTDFALQGEFYKKPYYKLQTAFSKLNIADKTTLRLKIHRFRAKLVRRVQSSLVGQILFKRSKFIRKILRH